MLGSVLRTCEQQDLDPLEVLTTIQCTRGKVPAQLTLPGQPVTARPPSAPEGPDHAPGAGQILLHGPAP